MLHVHGTCCPWRCRLCQSAEPASSAGCNLCAIAFTASDEWRHAELWSLSDLAASDSLALICCFLPPLNLVLLNTCLPQPQAVRWLCETRCSTIGRDRKHAFQESPFLLHAAVAFSVTCTKQDDSCCWQELQQHCATTRNAPSMHALSRCGSDDYGIERPALLQRRPGAGNPGMHCSFSASHSMGEQQPASSAGAMALSQR